MKITLNAFILFTTFAVQVFAGKENLLEDACGHVALSPEQIVGLYSWGADPTYVAIGADDSPEGLQSASLNHLVNISFEPADDISVPKELVAERAPLGRARYSGIQYCPAK